MSAFITYHIMGAAALLLTCFFFYLRLKFRSSFFLRFSSRFLPCPLCFSFVSVLCFSSSVLETTDLIFFLRLPVRALVVAAASAHDLPAYVLKVPSPWDSPSFTGVLFFVFRFFLLPVFSSRFCLNFS